MFPLFFNCWVAIMEDTYYCTICNILSCFLDSQELLIYWTSYHTTTSCLLVCLQLIISYCCALLLLWLTAFQLEIFSVSFYMCLLSYALWWKILIYCTLCSIVFCFGCSFTKPSATLQPCICRYLLVLFCLCCSISHSILIFPFLLWVHWKINRSTLDFEYKYTYASSLIYRNYNDGEWKLNSVIMAKIEVVVLNFFLDV